MSLKADYCRLGFSATIYHIWAQRNALLHQGYVKTEEQLVGLIRKQVKMRIGSLSSTRVLERMLNSLLGGVFQFYLFKVELLWFSFVWSHNVWAFMVVCFLALATLF